MTTTSKGKRPTHRAYRVTKTGDKSHWTELGAAWAHENGDGLTLRLKLMPLDGSDIVIRAIPDQEPAMPDQDAGEGSPS